MRCERVQPLHMARVAWGLVTGSALALEDPLVLGFPGSVPHGGLCSGTVHVRISPGSSPYKKFKSPG